MRHHRFTAASRRIALLTFVVVLAVSPVRGDEAPFDPPQIRINPPGGSPSSIVAILSFLDVLRMSVPMTIML